MVDAICDLVPDGSVLALGEPTHGTAEAFALKMDVICTLAERRRLGLFAMEDSWSVGLEVDAALSGHGELDAAWGQAMSVWRTETIVGGLRRLQRINAELSPRDRARFTGVDSKRPELAAWILREIGVTELGITALAHKSEVEPESVPGALAACEALWSHRGRRIRGSARQVWRRLDAYHRQRDFEGLGRRDAHMAQTLLEERERFDSGRVTVVWAHNEHVARNPVFCGSPAMGNLLEGQLGSTYIPLGILCGEGTCRAADPAMGDMEYRAVRLPSALPGSTEDALHAQRPVLIRTDSRSHPGPRRFLGWKIDSTLPPDAFELHRPTSDFQGIAWLPYSTADDPWDESGEPGEWGSRPR